MKPIRLVVSAFGPYVEEQEIDFTLVREQPLFLLTGPTGSGKTMLLDAICYALFGECSGEARKAPSVRSDHASPQQPTRIVFDFALGPEVYRVERSPEQERPKRRGTGTIREAPKATLWRRTCSGTDDPGEVLETQPLRVSDRITEILGFTSAQFRQVVVLPQGDFRRFLDAKSGEREEILEVLFQTGEYRRIEEALTARAAAVEGEWGLRKAERELILRQAGVPTREGLESEVARLTGTEAAKQAELSGLRASAERARAAVEKAREEDRRLRELRDSERAYDAVAVDRDANEGRKRDLALARSAAGVSPLERDAANRAREAAHAGDELQAAERELNTGVANDDRARRALQAEEQRQPERDKAARELQTIEAVRGKVRELEVARAELAKAREAAAAADKDARKAEAELSGCAHTIETRRAEHDDAVRRAEPVARLTVESQHLTLQHQRRKALEADERKLAEAAQTAARAREALATADTALKQAREKYREAESRWIDGQASLLARKLVEGQPCPVCGSAVHPAPAHSGEAVSSDAALKRARAEVERREREREGSAGEEHTHSLALAKAQAAVDEKRTALVDAADVPVEELARRRAAVQRELDGAQAAAQSAQQIRKEVEQLTMRERSLRERRDASDKSARNAAAKVAACDAIFRSREADVPEVLRAAGALEAAIARAQALVAQLDRALKQARNEAATAAEKLAGARTKEQAKRQAADRATSTAAAARVAFDEARAAAGFQTQHAYRAAVRSDDQIASLDRLIAKYEADFAKAEDRLRRAREAAQGLRQPDLAAVQAAAAEAGQRLEACLKEIADVAGKIGAARKQLIELDAIACECERLERRYRTVARIAEAANGRNNARVNFQRFVQATLLDRVLEAATERLRIMSRGRYELQRATGTLDRRASAGLDLEVFDAHTGAARPVSTLSGGESFQASLALALGLAGVVQSHAGGLRLESIFIDEGFGSLDADALALAMDTLRGLQQGGRLIGVVSHVAELKEQIGARLEVSPGKRGGSQAKFVLN